MSEKPDDNYADGVTIPSEVASHSATIAAYEYPAVYDYLGKDRYLQAAFCKSVAKLYSNKFGPYTTKYLSNIAAEEGFAELLEWCKDIGCRWDASLFLSGAKGGSVDILKFLKDNECPIPLRGFAENEVWRAAAERGHIEALQFAYTSNSIHDIQRLCEVAAETGQFHILKWIYEVEGNRHFHAYTCEHAARGGYIDMIQWLRSVECEWDEGACQAALEQGRLDLLKWLISNGCPFDVNSHGFIYGHSHLGLAAIKGQVEIMSFLLDECQANVNSTANVQHPPLFDAVAAKNLEAVKLLLDSGADVTTKLYGMTVFIFAQHLGEAEIVQALRDAGAQ